MHIVRKTHLQTSCAKFLMFTVRPFIYFLPQFLSTVKMKPSLLAVYKCLQSITNSTYQAQNNV